MLAFYRKLCPGANPNRAGPSKTPSRSQRPLACHPRQPRSDPLHPPPHRVQFGLKLRSPTPSRTPLGARATWVGRPGRPPGRVGWGLACPSWALDPVLPYTIQCIQNRAQSVKAKLHTWCNPMETSLNMNPNPNRFHMTYRHP